MICFHLLAKRCAVAIFSHVLAPTTASRISADHFASAPLALDAARASGQCRELLPILEVVSCGQRNTCEKPEHKT
jgi:hypothetical protein